MICPHCGAPLEDDSWFCPSCGKVLSGASSRAQTRHRTRTTAETTRSANAPHPTSRAASIDDAIIRAALESANPTPSPSMGDLLSATGSARHGAPYSATYGTSHGAPYSATYGTSHGSPYSATYAGSHNHNGDLSTQLAARQAYVPEPLVGASPLVAVGTAAAALALATTLGRTGAGISNLPTLASLVKPPSIEHATTDASASGSMATEKDTGKETNASSAQPAPGQPASAASQPAPAASQPAPAEPAPAEPQPSEAPAEPAPTSQPATTTASDLPYTYTLVHQAMTWAQAEAYCEQQGGQLAQPHTVAEWRAVLDLAESSDVYVIWLGGLRQADGTFDWLDGSPASLRVWAQDEPNNVDGTEDRLALLRYKNGAGLYDVPGDVSQAYPASYLGFVMQKEK